MCPPCPPQLVAPAATAPPRAMASNAAMRAAPSARPCAPPGRAPSAFRPAARAALRSTPPRSATRSTGGSTPRAEAARRCPPPHARPSAAARAASRRRSFPRDLPQLLCFGCDLPLHRAPPLQLWFQIKNSCQLYTQGHNGHLDWWVPLVSPLTLLSSNIIWMEWHTCQKKFARWHK